MFQRLQRAILPWRYRITHGSKFPKGDLVSTLHNFSRRGFSPRRIVDIGANQGKWSRHAMRVFPDAEYLLIEPQVEMKPHLDRLCRRATHARWLLCGVADTVGQMPFVVRADSTASHFDDVPPGVDGTSPGDPRAVGRRMLPVTTLDDLVRHHLSAVPDLVKIDAEGFEIRILEGGSSILGRTEAVFLEAHLLTATDDPCSFGNMVTRMGQYGYEPYDFTWFGKRPGDGAVTLCEVVFVRRDGYLRRSLGWTGAA
jgi:FkbM family methyltransferase